MIKVCDIMRHTYMLGFDRISEQKRFEIGAPHFSGPVSRHPVIQPLPMNPHSSGMSFLLQIQTIISFHAFMFFDSS
jgi:hypothetical protein